MGPRYQGRNEQLLSASQVPPTRSRGVMGRLQGFAMPCAASPPSPESPAHPRTHLAGLLPDVERKDAASSADRSDRDGQVTRRSLGEGDWDHDPMSAELARPVARATGRPDAGLGFDPSAFPEKGTASVGVQRQWCGRPGEVENGRLGVSLGSVGDDEHAPVDFRLSVPRGWAKDRKRRNEAGVPTRVGDPTRHERAPEVLPRHGGVLPHGWVAGDDQMGRPAWSRKRLAAEGRRDLLAVPPDTTVRHLEEPPPPYGGPGRRPEAPCRRVQAWGAAPAEARTTRPVRDGQRGPPEVEVTARRVESKIDRRVVGPEETLVVVRSTDGAALKHDDHLSDAAPGPPLVGFARVARASHRIAGCLKRSKSEAGPGECQVRNRRGWHHHGAMSLIATWFLVVEARRGKKDGPGPERTAGAGGRGADPASGQSLRGAGPGGAGADARAGAERVGAVRPLRGP